MVSLANMLYIITPMLADIKKFGPGCEVFQAKDFNAAICACHGIDEDCSRAVTGLWQHYLFTMFNSESR